MRENSPVNGSRGCSEASPRPHQKDLTMTDGQIRWAIVLTFGSRKNDQKRMRDGTKCRRRQVTGGRRG